MDDEFGLHKILESLSTKQLHNLIEHLILKNPDVRHLLLEWYKERIEKSAGSSEKEICTELNDELLMEYWNYASSIIYEFNEYGGGPEDEEDTAYEWLDRISEVIEEGNISHEAKIDFMDYAFIEYDKYNSGFEDSLAEIFFELCETDKEWKYLITKLGQHPSDWKNTLIMKILKDHLHDDDAYLKFRLKDLEYGNDYWELASFYAKRGNTEKAVETAETGLLEGKGRLTELFEFLFDHFTKMGDIDNAERIARSALERGKDEKKMLDKLFEYYRSQGNYEKARDALLSAFVYVHYSDVYKEYQKMKNYLKKEEWNGVEPEIFSSLRNKNIIAYLQVCMDKNMKPEVLDILLDIQKGSSTLRSVDEIDKFAVKLKDEFPREIIEYYWQKAYCNILGGNRKTYRIAETYLIRVKEIYIGILHEKPVWDERLNSLKVEFKRRPAFLEEISKFST
ncbi:MAG: hypothetical protein JXA98_01845 [Methanosarcinaceae archaeon]|nr:hypothetical protein [Methanosarcinaceae archaeon]